MHKRMWFTAATVVALLSATGAVPDGAYVLAAESRRILIVDADSNAMKWGFEPAGVTVPAGSTVVWHNAGSQTHTVTADDRSFDSPDLASGADWQWTFPATGDFPYHCRPHPWMKGVVRVVAISTPTTAASATPTTQPAASATTATSAPRATPAPAAAASQAAPTTTTTVTIPVSTTATAAPTDTTLAPAATTTSAPTADEPAAAAGTQGGSDHGRGSPAGIAFAVIATLAVTGAAAKMLRAKP